MNDLSDAGLVLVADPVWLDRISRRYATVVQAAQHKSQAHSLCRCVSTRDWNL
jgi:hypothetical protein